MDQIFTIKAVMREYLGKGRKLLATFMDSEKVCDTVNREAPCNVQKIYGVRGQLLERIKAFYREANACVRMEGQLTDSFLIRVGVRQGCIMSPWLFIITLSTDL